MIFQKILQSLTVPKQAERVAMLRRNLLRHEAKIGGTLFGPVPAGGRREFFRLDKYTWVWYEEWIDKNGDRQSKTTRYEFRDHKVLKSQNGQYRPITLAEAERLRDAIQQYGEKVYKELYAKILQQ